LEEAKRRSFRIAIDLIQEIWVEGDVTEASVNTEFSKFLVVGDVFWAYHLQVVRR
jgi:hypothetical protein